MTNRIKWFLAFFLIGSCQGIVQPKVVGTDPGTTSLHPQPLSPQIQARPNRPVVPAVPGAITKKCHGNFCYESRTLGEMQVMRYTPGTGIISRNDFISGLADPNNNDLRLTFNQSIADLPAPIAPNDGYMVWAPVINEHTKDQTFYLVAMAKSGFSKNVSDRYASQFKHCDPHPVINEREYQDRFLKMFASKNGGFTEIQPTNTTELKNGAVIFKGGINKGPNPSEIMVSPCPIDKNLTSSANQDLTDIYSFTKMLEHKTPDNLARLHSFWLAVGKAAMLLFDRTQIKDLAGHKKTKLLLNTHGRTVNYLHFRVETESADYIHYEEHAGDVGKKMLDDKQSQEYYEQAFPVTN